MSEAHPDPFAHNPEMLHLAMSEKAKPLLEKVKAFIRDHVDPITEEFYALGEGREDRWSWAPGQLELLDGAKEKAKSLGLWNFFLPDADTGEGDKVRAQYKRHASVNLCLGLRRCRDRNKIRCAACVPGWLVRIVPLCN